MKKTKPILNPDHVDEMFHALCKLHPRFGLMWQVGTVCGLRIGDLLNVRLWHVHEFLWVEEQKTKRIRGIFMPPWLRLNIELFRFRHGLKPGHFLFYSHDARKHIPMSRQWAHRIIARTARLNGLQHIGAHSMRKIYACDLYRRTRSIEAVKASLGHKSIGATFFYLREVLENSG